MTEKTNTIAVSRDPGKLEVQVQHDSAAIQSCAWLIAALALLVLAVTALVWTWKRPKSPGASCQNAPRGQVTVHVHLQAVQSPPMAPVVHLSSSPAEPRSLLRVRQRQRQMR